MEATVLNTNSDIVQCLFRSSSQQKRRRLLCGGILTLGCVLCLASFYLNMRILFGPQSQDHDNDAPLDRRPTVPTDIQQSFEMLVTNPDKRRSIVAVSAHKYLSSAVGETDQKTLQILHQYNDDRYEHSYGIVLTPSGLKVEHPGLYYVYKSIYFQPSANSNCRGDKVMYTSTIQRRHDGGVENLLTSNYKCHPDYMQSRETSFVGGVFSLRKNDVIQVNVNAETAEHIQFSRDASYYGLMLIQGQGRLRSKLR